MSVLVDLTPASAVCLSVSGYAALSIPVLLVPGFTVADFDPRPAVGRAAVHVLLAAVLYLNSQKASTR